MKKIAIAIDGPAGAGKSTVARMVAEQLSYIYIDTGAMYRSVTWKVLDTKTVLDNKAEIEELAQHIVIEFERNENGQNVFVDGTDVTEAIRSSEVTNLVSYISSLAGVRERMVKLQQIMAEEGGVVVDGRDIGTVVLPNAELKIFLTASIEERARRRYDEMMSKGYTGTLSELQEEMRIRDLKDSEREISPLRQAEDAMLLDSTGLTIEEVVSKIVSLGRTKMGSGE